MDEDETWFGGIASKPQNGRDRELCRGDIRRSSNWFPKPGVAVMDLAWCRLGRRPAELFEVSVSGVSICFPGSRRQIDTYCPARQVALPGLDTRAVIRHRR